MTIPNLLIARCEAHPSLIDKDDLAEWLGQVPGWSCDDASALIARRFEFDNYYQSMAFANAVAEIAHAQDHHPEMLVGYRVVTVSYSTHSLGGLTANDFISAAQVSALPEAAGE